MIRFILKHRHGFDGHGCESLYTLDVDVPELERQLIRGGFDIAEGRFELVELVGAEVRLADDRIEKP